jgi:hypothetical protein
MADETRMPDQHTMSDESPVEYEAPRLRAVGNLRDLLAGTGSLPCDGMTIASGPDPASGTPGQPDQCGSG